MTIKDVILEYLNQIKKYVLAMILVAISYVPLVFAGIQAIYNGTYLLFGGLVLVAVVLFIFMATLKIYIEDVTKVYERNWCIKKK